MSDQTVIQEDVDQAIEYVRSLEASVSEYNNAVRVRDTLIKELRNQPATCGACVTKERVRDLKDGVCRRCWFEPRVRKATSLMRESVTRSNLGGDWVAGTQERLDDKWWRRPAVPQRVHITDQKRGLRISREQAGYEFLYSKNGVIMYGLVSTIQEAIQALEISLKTMNEISRLTAQNES